MLKKIATGTVLAAFAACGIFLGAGAASERRTGVPAVGVARTFVPACKARDAGDTRPDPAWVGQSFAHDNCWAPRMPALIDGSTASRSQIVVAMAAAKRFASLSDAYQRCIVDFVAARRGEKPLAMTLVLIENHRITASRASQRKAADQVAAEIDAFNAYGSECPE